MTPDGIPCMMMRGGTSKGAYFLADDLPSDPAQRDRLLLRIMGSPDPRQIDGIGGADPLTSKVAVVQASTRPGFDVDFLFLQVFVDQALVSDSQNCGNILAGVGAFAVERGLVRAGEGETAIRIYMENTAQSAVARIRTKDGRPDYAGEAHIDGVPGSAAPVYLAFTDAAGSSCGALLPTGSAATEIEGVTCTLIDNGMPVVVMRAADFGLTGYESREELESNDTVKARIERIRLAAGPLMNLGDVAKKSVPKMTLVAPPMAGGAIMTRSLIPHRVHASIGVFGALSVATACMFPDSPAASMAVLPEGEDKTVSVEHPTGSMEILLRLNGISPGMLAECSFLRTARKLVDGRVFV
ncbi:4-oxalomesaconate tautomerase [Mycoplana sp. BE70]|uniref:4-oxalomesaconate tautomerase n=1 Tax=Mycoplana sp. BE70 TaxID=2817775 RepID=UPI00285E2D5E|nr:4-oxalomesaconate tautomerase [Mycoplana sp. BE70]MDR6759387.1 4-oxalomesaconate tautomerase [Mycoplana sp. BE70]